MASASAKRSRLAKAVAVARNTSSSLSHTSKPWQHMPQYWLCRCIKWRLYKKKHGLVWTVAVQKRSQHYPLNKPSYFLFQDFASKTSYACERIIIIMNMKIWTNWQISVLENTHTDSFLYLVLTRWPIIIIKKSLRVILSWKMLFKESFCEKKHGRSLLWTHYHGSWYLVERHTLNKWGVIEHSIFSGLIVEML